jgi:hypothetical protein
VEATYNPFAILNVDPGVSLEAVRSSYRRLARKHHPDVAPEHEREAATRLMAALNDAMADLESDFEGWTRRFVPGLQAGPPKTSTTAVLSVEPRLLILSDANGRTAFVTVATRDGDGRQIRLRYPEGLIVADRLPVGGRGVASFRVRVSPRVRELTYPERVEVELVAPGYAPAVVTVAVEPFAVAGAEGPPARERGWADRIRHWVGW